MGAGFLGVELELHHLDWVGLGTIFLGLATFVLAFLTRRAVNEAEKDRVLAQRALDAALLQASVAQQTLDVEIQPIIIEVPLDLSQEDLVHFPDGPQGVRIRIVVGGVYVHIDDEIAVCSVPFRNVGRGVAAVATAWLEEGGGSAGYAARDLTRPNLPTGETLRANFVFRRGEGGFAHLSHRVAHRDGLVVGVRYADVAGRQVRDTRLEIRFSQSAHTNWETVYVEVGDPDTGEPLPPGAQGPPPV